MNSSKWYKIHWSTFVLFYWIALSCLSLSSYHVYSMACCPTWKKILGLLFWHALAFFRVASPHNCCHDCHPHLFRLGCGQHPIKLIQKPIEISWKRLYEFSIASSRGYIAQDRQPLPLCKACISQIQCPFSAAVRPSNARRNALIRNTHTCLRFCQSMSIMTHDSWLNNLPCHIMIHS